MSLRTRTLVENENLIGRQKKLDSSKNVLTKRTALADLETNALDKPVNTNKTTIIKTIDIKKTVANVRPNKIKVTKLIKSDTIVHVSDKKPTIHQSVIDVDANDKGDPYLVPEYVQDIFKYLRAHEEKYTVKKGYLASHKSTSRMRSVLVNWMVDVHLNFKLMLETLHLSVAILDRYLQINNKVGTDSLQLVGVTSMVIACKYEEMYMPPLYDFAEVSDNFFNCEDIKKMELEVLRELKFNLGRPLSLHFLRRYSKIANVLPKHHNLAKYLLEIFLLEYELCHINPSLQAAAACCLSLSVLNEVPDPSKVWTKTLVHYSLYKYADIKPVVINLAYYLYKMSKSKYLAIHNKYATSTYEKISLNPKLQGPLIKKLIEQRQTNSLNK